MYIGIDFDGTCTSHDFPGVGKDIGAEPVLRKLVERGHKLILFTMRSNLLTPYGGEDESNDITPDVDGRYLNDAIRWFRDRKLPLFGINTNPTQNTWTESPKAFCNLYIDDAALGCPLIVPEIGRSYVDWVEVEKKLKMTGVL